MTSKHGLTLAALILILPSCGGLEPGDEAFERGASGEGVALADFAGTFDRLDPEGNAIEGSSLRVSVQGGTIYAYTVAGGQSHTVMHAEVGADPKVEKYTVSSQGFFGPSRLERRKVVTTATQAGRTVERKIEMYSWDVSYKVWEDWTLYGVITDKLILVDDETMAWDHFESQVDSHATRQTFLRRN